MSHTKTGDLARRRHKSALYCIFCALRGPDIEEYPAMPLKSLVVGRIRYIAQKRGYCRIPAGAVVTSTHFTVEDLKNIKEEMKGASHQLDHFLRHLAMAVTVTSTHSIWGGLAGKLWEALSADRT